MRILYLIQYFNLPGEPGGSRAYQFAKHWAASGHDVEIVTAGVNQKTGRMVTDFQGKPYTIEKMEGFRVRRVWSYAKYKGSMSRRYLSFVTYTASAVLFGPHRWRPDVVFASSTPLTTGIAGALHGIAAGRPFVFEARDLWPKAALVAGVLKEGPVYRGAALLERWIYARARQVIVVSRGDREELITRGLEPARIHWVPNGVDDWMLASPPEAVPRGDGPLRVLYVGAHGRWNHLDMLLNLAAEVEDLAHFTFIGDGDEKPRLQELARTRSLRNVVFEGAMPKRAAFQRMQRADVTILASGTHPHYDQWLPNKIFDYMAAGRPVLVLGRGELAQLVENSGCGLAVPADSIGGAAAALRSLHSMNAPQLDSMGRCGWEVAGRLFSRKAHAGEMVEIFLSAINGGTPPMNG